ncbi:MAG: FAD-dependent oxidoreductase [Microthrixaceae bacterium]|nr:FAD-dependent oxidoreductase [Microthrixaceae bacterium]
MRVVVIGAGAMGSATAWQLAAAGADVTLLEQFERGHDRGSSHGTVRIFRLAYADDLYVGMALASQPLWAELEEAADEELVEHVGALDHGVPERIHEVAASLTRAGVRHDLVGPEEAAERWPFLRIEGPAVFQPDGGISFADRTVRAAQDVATALGAEVGHEEPARAVHLRDGGVVVETDRRELRADVVVVSAGAWAAPVAGDLVPLPPLTVTFQQPGWFAPRDPSVVWPSFIHYRDTSSASAASFGAYGMGDPGVGGRRTTFPGTAVKVGEESVPVVVDPDDGPFEVRQDALRRLADYVEIWLPGLDPVPLRAETCLFTQTPNDDFVLDRRGPVVVASPCSGHGFKFTPLIGKLVADLVRAGPDAAPPDPRFALPA